MADIKVEFLFQTTLTQQEFSVVTRALAGHTLKDHDLILARQLNMRLLGQRVGQLEAYKKSSTRALEVAQMEMEATK